MKVRPFYKILSYGAGSYKETLHLMLMKKLENESFDQVVICPKDEDINQWIAIHLVFFFNDINFLYGAVQENCTNYSCPFMSAGSYYEYLWADHYKYKTATRVPAKTYIDYLMNWITALLENKSLFLSGKHDTFPANYVAKVKSIARRYFQVYAHIYHSHLDALRKLGIEKTFFDSVAYYFYFVDMYSLVPIADLRPLACLMYRLVPNLKITCLLIQEEKEARKRRRIVVSSIVTDENYIQSLDCEGDCLLNPMDSITHSVQSTRRGGRMESDLSRMDVMITRKNDSGANVNLKSILSGRTDGLRSSSYSTPVETSGVAILT